MNCIGGIILGELESTKWAKEYAEKMKNCPHLLSSVFSVVGRNTLCLVYIITTRKSS
jgi:hypothetical protein